MCTCGGVNFIGKGVPVTVSHSSEIERGKVESLRDSCTYVGLLLSSPHHLVLLFFQSLLYFLFHCLLS